MTCKGDIVGLAGRQPVAFANAIVRLHSQRLAAARDLDAQIHAYIQYVRAKEFLREFGLNVGAFSTLSAYAMSAGSLGLIFRHFLSINQLVLVFSCFLSSIIHLGRAYRFKAEAIRIVDVGMRAAAARRNFVSRRY